MFNKKRILLRLGVGLIGLAIGVSVYLLGPGRRAKQSAANLREIALGMLNYHSEHDCLPPSVFTDSEGQTGKSWRVALFEFMQEPTEGMFHAPASSESAENSSYFMVTPPAEGHMTIAGRGNRGSTLSDVFDGLSFTIMLVEVEGLNTPWDQPGDISIEDFMTRFRSRSVGPHPEGIFVAFVDGSVHFISYDADPVDVESLLYLSDGGPGDRLADILGHES